ncbi:MAG: hypothetical protein JNM72_06130 [Deltaproteobacteria bacterium]|jgi:hypothetical protein|nr:hypothetical protein [Deltaproteobacteria bacterium]
MFPLPSPPASPFAHLLAALLVAAAGAGCSGGPKPADDSGSGADGADGGSEGSVDGGAGDGGPADPCGEAAVVEVGTGAAAFEPFGDPATAVMVHGPQGGWHMLGSLRVTGLQQIVSVRYTVTHQASGVVVADNQYRVGMLYDADTCVGSYPGMYGYLNVAEMVDGEADTPPELLSWQPVELCLEVDDGARAGAACGVVEAVPDPMDLASGLAPPRPD